MNDDHRFVIASANPDKAREIREILGEAIPSIELLPRPGSVAEVEETGETLTENALLKARALVDATGTAAIADDTGLEVEALDGAPGVYSARYAGPDASYSDNVNKLLRALQGQDNRRAMFRSVVVAVLSSHAELVFEGAVAGTIADAARGTSGFGYDAIFVPDEGDGRTYAEMTATEKNAFSHRGRALRGLARLLEGG